MALAPIPDGTGRMLLAEQSGLIHLLDRDGRRAEPTFLNLRSNLVAINQGMEERGLLGLALHPQFRSNGRFYVVYSAPLRTNAPPQWDHAERLSEFRLPNSGPVDRFYFRSLYFREPHGVLFEIATDGPGFAADEPKDKLGEKLALPPFLEPRRREIEAGLKPL